METYKEGVQAGETFYEQTTVVGGGFNIAYNNNNNNSSIVTTTTTTPAPSSRWNPTPEQLLALKEIYQQGIRTPSANQIQQIAVELLRFGKIEGKNVFYWFQNHKARERQKRRREGESNIKLQKQEADKRESGIRKSAHHDQLQHSKNLVASSNCQTNTEGLVPIQWQQEFQKRELELQQQEKENTKKNQLSQTARNDTWQNGFFPSAKFLELHQEQCSYLSDCTTLESEAREIQTLQLFPLRNINDDYEGVIKTDKRDKELAVTAINTKSSPGQFFEFLPLKN